MNNTDFVFRSARSKTPDDCHGYLETRHLNVSYRGKAALSNVTLSIDAGKITSLIGPSGCGKTTFLQCLNRLTDLIPGCQVTGTVRIGSLNVFDPALDVTALRRDVGMIFQKPNPFPLSIYKNIWLPLHEHGVRDRHLLEEKIEKALVDVGLWGDVKDRLQSSALSLSGGQQQRLCIARALILEPHVLLMDEPCSSLDPISSGVVEDLILRLRGRFSVVVVTHNLAQAKRISDDAALFWVRDGVGGLVETGTTTALFENPTDACTKAYVTGMRG